MTSPQRDQSGSIYVPGPEQPFTLQQMAHPSPPAPPQKRARWPLAVIAGLAALVVAGGVAFVALAGSGAPPATAQASPSPSWSSVFGSNPTRAAAAPVYTPTPKDFELAIKVIEKKCFGSAGCNVTFRIELTYTGLTLDPSSTYEVVYRVDGAEDTYINSLRVTGASYSHDDEERVSVKSSKSVLTAVVTDVNER